MYFIVFIKPIFWMITFMFKISEQVKKFFEFMAEEWCFSALAPLP